jgi:Zn-dependent metalloprotease
MKSQKPQFDIQRCGCVCTIVPIHILVGMSKHSDEKIRRVALGSMLLSERLRGRRDALSFLGAVALTNPTGTKRRTIYDAQRTPNLPGKLVRSEGAKKSKDLCVNEAYDYSGTTYDFYQTVFGRNSIDNKGMRLDSTVHFCEVPSEPFDNAQWDGTQMVYGDGDGVAFQRFTKCLDIVGHELTHGVTQFEAGLAYQGQSGALNESISDVFGSLVKQWKQNETAAQADWLIGDGLFTNKINGKALRSMKEPGTAYDDEMLGGKDPQPGHMKDFVKLPSTRGGDWGGVHINSGIPNRAFYLAATAIGGNAWKKAGLIWYEALCGQLNPSSDFAHAATCTTTVAANKFGNGSKEHNAVKSAWEEVGVI